MIKEQGGIKIKGLAHLELFGPDGILKQEQWVKNIITTVGLTHIADRMASTLSEDAMGYMAVGTDATAVAAGNTALGGEVASSRTALSSRTHSGAVVTYVCSFGAGVGTGALYEAGIFNAAAAGIMLNRLTYAVVNKGASDTLQITWSLTFSDDGA
jgi:hypothetical protein